jgi:hypothetical protein
MRSTRIARELKQNTLQLAVIRMMQYVRAPACKRFNALGRLARNVLVSVAALHALGSDTLTLGGRLPRHKLKWIS